MIAETILSLFCKPPQHANTSGSASGDALGLLRREYPDLAELVRGKVVADFGCGAGRQAQALALEFGARVYGIENNPRTLERARKLTTDRVAFVPSATDLPETVDVLISQNSMEHFSDPEHALAEMRRAIRPGGLALITFGPPWFAPYGSHMHFFCWLPWVNILFPERAVMRVRSKYCQDNAARYEEVESGLNKMSIRKMEGLLRRSDFTVIRLDFRCVWRMNWLAKIPLLRELFINHVTLILKA